MSRVSSPEIRAIVAAEVVSSIGSSMAVLALPWFVLVTTGSAAKLGLVLGIGSIPFVTLPLLAGSVIARIGARQTMVIADAARLPLVAAIPALYSLDALSFPLLVVLVALTNVFMAAHMPAQRLILAEVVGDEESVVARVNAYLDGAQTTAPLVGPALAGVLIAALGAPNVLYVDAATFGVAAIAVGLFVRRRKPLAEAEGRGLLAGLRYVLRSRLLIVLCVTMLTMEFFFALFMTTLPVFAYSDFDQNAHIAGVFYAAMGAGALLGMFVVSRVRRFGALHVAAGALVLASIPKLLLGFPLPAAGVTADRRADLHRHHDAHTRSAPNQGAVRRVRGDVPHRAVRPDCHRPTDQRGRAKNGDRHRRGRIPGRVRAVRHLRCPKPACSYACWCWLAGAGRGGGWARVPARRAAERPYPLIESRAENRDSLPMRA
jgi:MFS family permease